ncbi:TlpA disulfide reductase family protein, partial [Micrococcus sp.]
APVLKELSAKYKGKGAAFLGANVRDEKETAEAFERAFGIAYPSVRDIEGKVLLALSKYVPLKSVPVTVVVDPEGRVAARILGAADKSTLDTLIKDNIA